MKLILRFAFLSCFLFCSFGVNGQVIYGYVYDGSKEVPLPGATVYINGTTIGTITNLDGRFTIKTDRVIEASLVVSYIGYKTVPVNNPFRDEILEVILQKQTDELGEAVVKTGREYWSRKKMLREFKKQFLGNNRAGQLCMILNEDDIDLEFQPENETLLASCDVPIQIRNNLLGYNIQYTLNAFEAKYDSPQRRNPYCRFVYYEGTSYYQDITSNQEILARFERSRNDEYKGSTSHFFKTLIKGDLKDEGFKLYNGILPIETKRVFTIQNFEDKAVVDIKKNFFLDYKGNERSLVTKRNDKTTFLVYPNGNFTPARDLRFDGALALERIGSTLPLDYEPEED